MGLPILLTKITIPPARAGVLPRQRLASQLEATRDKALVLVLAPAGYGKTTLVSTWARQSDRHVAWFAIEAGDNDFARFFSGLIRAIQSIQPAFGQSILEGLASFQPVSTELVLVQLLNEMAEVAEPISLVLDDYHLVTLEDIQRAIGFVLEHLPATFQFILVSRRVPPIPLSRFRARGRVAELQAVDLRFSSDEIRRFLREVMGLERLTSADLTALETRTEGWAAGLQMAALVLRGQASASSQENLSETVHLISGRQRYILDYLTDEVLAGQPGEIQHFLLQSSVLEQLSAPLCDAVLDTHQSQALLEYLEANNLFIIPLDGERQLYRYHQLFRELLYDRLQRTQPAHVSALHMRASQWMESAGRYDEAIAHVLEIKDEATTIQAAEKIMVHLLVRGEPERARFWLAKLPEELIRRRPILCIAQAFISIYLYPYEWERVERWLEAGREALTRCEDFLIASDLHPYQTARELVLAQEAQIRATIAWGREDPTEQAFEYARQITPDQDFIARSYLQMELGRTALQAGQKESARRSVEQAVELAEKSCSPTALARTLWAKAYTAYWHGQLAEAVQIYQRVHTEVFARAESTQGQFFISGMVNIFWGIALEEFDQLDQAENLIQKGLSLCAMQGNIDGIRAGQLELAWLRTYQGDTNGVKELAASLVKLPAQVQAFTSGHLAQMQLYLGYHLPMYIEKAFRWVELRHGQMKPLEQREPTFVTWCRVVLARKKIGHARPGVRELLEPLQAQRRIAREAGYLRHEVRAMIVEALLWQALGEAGRAADSMAEALVLSEPEGYLRTFVDEGPEVKLLLETALAQGILPEYVQRLLEAFETDEKRWQKSLLPAKSEELVTPVTRRELEILKLIALGLSNRQIADQLFLSLATVKKYTFSLFQKLNVDRRTQAVVRARELGLL